MPAMFGVGQLIGLQTHDSSGTALAIPVPVQFGILQEVGVDMSFESKKLYGSGKFPVAIAQGKGSITAKAKTASVDGAVMGALFFGKTPTTGVRAIVSRSAVTIPSSSPYTITVAPPHSGTFAADLGFIDATTGLPMTRVASAPSAGQYSVSAGVYTFAAADSGKAGLQTYEYTSNTGGKIYTITNDQLGYQPSFTLYLQGSYKGSNVAVKFNYVVSSKLSLPFKNEDFVMSDIDMDIGADASDIVGTICYF